MDLFNLISTPNPSKVRTRTRPRAAHEVLLLTSTTNYVIEMEDTVVALRFSGTPATIEKSPLDFADENPPPVITESGDIAIVEVIHEASLEKKGTAMGPDHVASHPSHSTLGGKSLAAIEIEAGSAITAPTTQETPVSDPEPLSYAEPRPTPEQDIAQSSKKVSVAKDPDSEKSTSFTSMAREKHIKNLEALFEAEADMKKAAEAKNVELVKELEGLRVQFSNLQVSNKQLSQQVSSLQAQVTGEERIKAAFEEFKKYEDDKLEKRCMSEGLEYGVKQGEAKLDLAAIEAYDPVADDKYVTALHALKDLKYSLVDQLEKLKDTPLDLIMASLYLENDTGEDAP
ncbi:hypothetical protein Tco_0449114 [Tanacetum coccineum]